MARKFHPPRRTLRLRCALRRIAPADNPVRIFQRSHRVKVRLRFPVRNRQILGNGLFRRPHQTHGERHLRVLETKVGWQLQIVFLPKSQCRLHCLHRPVEIVEFDQPLGPQQKLVQQDLRWELVPFSCSGCKPEKREEDRETTKRVPDHSAFPPGWRSEIASLSDWCAPPRFRAATAGVRSKGSRATGHRPRSDSSRNTAMRLPREKVASAVGGEVPGAEREVQRGERRGDGDDEARGPSPRGTPRGPKRGWRHQPGAAFPQG